MFTALGQTNQNCDTVIWNSFKNGDREAFATLYYRYFTVLTQNCFRLSSDKKLIEDCIQDLFLEIWTNKVNLATPASVKAYLLCSTQRKIVRQLKKGRAWQSKVGQFQQPEEIYSIEEMLIAEQQIKETNYAINRALSTLTKRQQQAVAYRYFDNLSYPEISIKMQISIEAVYNLVSKALDSTQKQLQKKTCAQHSSLN